MATAVKVDIATRFVGAREDMYIIRPGDGFSLYEDFVRQKAVFLDFPDIRLNFAGGRPKRDALRQAVVRSMELRSWHRAHRVGDEPSRGTHRIDLGGGAQLDHRDPFVSIHCG